MDCRWMISLSGNSYTNCVKNIIVDLADGIQSCQITCLLACLIFYASLPGRGWMICHFMII